MSQTPALPELWWSYSEQMVYRGEEPTWTIGVAQKRTPDTLPSDAVRLMSDNCLASENNPTSEFAGLDALRRELARSIRAEVERLEIITEQAEAALLVELSTLRAERRALWKLLKRAARELLDSVSIDGAVKAATEVALKREETLERDLVRVRRDLHEAKGQAAELRKYWLDWPQKRRDAVKALSAYVFSAIEAIARQEYGQGNGDTEASPE